MPTTPPPHLSMLTIGVWSCLLLGGAACLLGTDCCSVRVLLQRLSVGDHTIMDSHGQLTVLVCDIVDMMTYVQVPFPTLLHPNALDLDAYDLEVKQRC